MKEKNKAEKAAKQFVSGADIKASIHRDLSASIAFLHVLLNDKVVFDQVVSIVEKRIREVDTQANMAIDSATKPTK